MKPILYALSVFATVCAGSASAKLYVQERHPECRGVAGSGAGNAMEISDTIDGRALSAAIQREMNLKRCDHGLAPFGGLAELRDVSRSHAEWMSAEALLSYKSGVEGQESLLARMKSLKAPAVRARQSILRVPTLNVPSGKTYKVSSKRCFNEDSDGQTLEKHTYASLARRVVATLFKSGQHRGSILSKKMTHAAAGADVSFVKNACGMVYISIHYVGLRAQKGMAPFQSRY